MSDTRKLMLMAAAVLGAMPAVAGMPECYHLGYFDTVAAASDAYAKAAASKGFHTNHAIIRAMIAQEGEA